MLQINELLPDLIETSEYSSMHIDFDPCLLQQNKTLTISLALINDIAAVLDQWRDSMECLYLFVDAFGNHHYDSGASVTIYDGVVSCVLACFWFVSSTNAAKGPCL